MSSFTVESICKNAYDLGEGPHYDERNDTLYFVDAFVGDVIKLNNGSTEKHNFGDLVTIVIPFEDSLDDLLISVRNKVIKFNWDSKESEIIAEVSKEKQGKERFNDGKCDDNGRLFIGTVLHGEGGEIIPYGGSIWRLDGGNFTKLSTGFTISNGMAWSEDNTKFYFNDSEDRKVYVFDYDLENGDLSNKRILIDCDINNGFNENEYPDGMTIDKNGNLWIAMYAGGRIVQVNPVNGTVIDSIQLPKSKIPTSVIFGGPNNDQLYATTASSGLSSTEKEIQSEAGHVLRVSGPELKGLKYGRRCAKIIK